MLGRQIAGKPIDSAILQMMFSDKRASKRIKSMLVVAKDHAQGKGMDATKIVVGGCFLNHYRGVKAYRGLYSRSLGVQG